MHPGQLVSATCWFRPAGPKAADWTRYPQSDPSSHPLPACSCLQLEGGCGVLSGFLSWLDKPPKAAIERSLSKTVAGDFRRRRRRIIRTAKALSSRFHNFLCLAGKSATASDGASVASGPPIVGSQPVTSSPFFQTVAGRKYVGTGGDSPCGECRAVGGRHIVWMSGQRSSALVLFGRLVLVLAG